MSWAKNAKSWDEPHCRECMHTNEAEPDGSCSAYGYNGVDCQAQPCTCRNHVVMLHQNPADVTCEACDAGYRLAPDGLHYNDEAGGRTWGVCRKIVAELEAAASTEEGGEDG